VHKVHGLYHEDSMYGISQIAFVDWIIAARKSNVSGNASGFIPEVDISNLGQTPGILRFVLVSICPLHKLQLQTLYTGKGGQNHIRFVNK
jgi:hypothetical protein